MMVATPLAASHMDIRPACSLRRYHIDMINTKAGVIVASKLGLWSAAPPPSQRAYSQPEQEAADQKTGVAVHRRVATEDDSPADNVDRNELADGQALHQVGRRELSSEVASVEDGSSRRFNESPAEGCLLNLPAPRVLLRGEV